MHWQLFDSVSLDALLPQWHFVESSHIPLQKNVGGQIESIVVWPLGGFSVCGPTKGGPGDDLCIALAGPVTHILQAGLWLALYSITTEGDFSSWTDAVDIPQLSNGGFFTFLSLLSAQAAIINVVLLVINLFVPAYPLDGGRIMSSLLVMAHFKVPVAAKATGFLGLTIGIALLVQGIVYFFIMPVGASYGILLAIVAGFAINSSTVLLRLTFHGLVHEHPLFSRQCYAEVFSEVRTDASLPMDMNELELT